MKQNDTYTTFEVSTIHENWTKWVFPDEFDAQEKIEELLLDGYEDLRLFKVTYESRNNVILEKQLLQKMVAIYG